MQRICIAAVVLLVTAACGRIGFDPRSDSGAAIDASRTSDTGSTSDSPLDAGSFSAPTRLMQLDDMDDPFVTADLLTVYLGSNGDVYESARASVDLAFPVPQRVSALSVLGFIESVPALSPDDGTMWLGCGQPGVWRGICLSTQTGGAWTAAEQIPELTDVGADSPGSVFDADRRMLLTSTVDGRTQIFASERPSITAPWSSPATVAGLNDGVASEGPHVVRDGLRVYFTADSGDGQRDIYVADRAELEDPFEPPRVVAELSSSFDDYDVWVSADERTALFVSDRGGIAGVYEARRP